MSAIEPQLLMMMRMLAQINTEELREYCKEADAENNQDRTIQAMLDPTGYMRDQQQLESNRYITAIARKLLEARELIDQREASVVQPNRRALNLD